jgi:hypothetical protein
MHANEWRLHVRDVRSRGRRWTPLPRLRWQQSQRLRERPFRRGHVRILHEFLHQRVLVRTAVAGRLLVPQRLTSTSDCAAFPARVRARSGQGPGWPDGRRGIRTTRFPASNSSRAARSPFVCVRLVGTPDDGRRLRFDPRSERRCRSSLLSQSRSVLRRRCDGIVRQLRGRRFHGRPEATIPRRNSQGTASCRSAFEVARAPRTDPAGGYLGRRPFRGIASGRVLYNLRLARRACRRESGSGCDHVVHRRLAPRRRQAAAMRAST